MIQITKNMWELLFKFIDGEQVPKTIKDKKDKVTILEKKSDDLLNQVERLIYKLDILQYNIKRVLNK